jgi:hypothetical protein
VSLKLAIAILLPSGENQTAPAAPKTSSVREIFQNYTKKVAGVWELFTLINPVGNSVVNYSRFTIKGQLDFSVASPIFAVVYIVFVYINQTVIWCPQANLNIF